MHNKTKATTIDNHRHLETLKDGAQKGKLLKLDGKSYRNLMLNEYHGEYHTREFFDNPKYYYTEGELPIMYLGFQIVRIHSKFPMFRVIHHFLHQEKRYTCIFFPTREKSAIERQKDILNYLCLAE